MHVTYLFLALFILYATPKFEMLNLWKYKTMVHGTTIQELQF